MQEQHETQHFALHRHLFSRAGEVVVSDDSVAVDAPYFTHPLVVTCAQIAAAGMLEPTSIEVWPMPQRTSVLHANFALVFRAPVNAPPPRPTSSWWLWSRLARGGRAGMPVAIPGLALRMKDPIALLDALEAQGVTIDDDIPIRIRQHH